MSPLASPPGVGDRAPDFALPAADGSGTLALAEVCRRGPVLLVMLRGLYCPFCRRHISQLRPTCEAFRAAGLALLGIVIASPERAQQYFRRFPACFPIAAAPDRAMHRAYGLTEMVRTPEMRQSAEQRAEKALREMGLEAPAGQAGTIFATAGGFEPTPEDDAEYALPVQRMAYFLVGQDGVVRWADVTGPLAESLDPAKLLALL
jgi:peroxiredoxin